MSSVFAQVMAKQTQPKPPGCDLSAQLRAAILTSGEKYAQIARGMGVDRSAISRFMTGQIAMSSASIDKLARYLHLRVVPQKEWERKSAVYNAWIRGTLPQIQQTRAKSVRANGVTDGQ
jgi:transcriptional regulator with XRE-family HTH domain